MGGWTGCDVHWLHRCAASERGWWSTRGGGTWYGRRDGGGHVYGADVSVSTQTPPASVSHADIAFLPLPNLHPHAILFPICWSDTSPARHDQLLPTMSAPGIISVPRHPATLLPFSRSSSRCLYTKIPGGSPIIAVHGCATFFDSYSVHRLAQRAQHPPLPGQLSPVLHLPRSP